MEACSVIIISCSRAAHAHVPVWHVQDKLVQQQLGPVPPAAASPGMVMQYNTMFLERKRSLLIDHVNCMIEHMAALLVKVGHNVQRAVSLHVGCQPMHSRSASGSTEQQ